MPTAIFTVALALLACCAVGTAVAFAQARNLSAPAQFYVWLLGLLLLVSVGVML